MSWWVVLQFRPDATSRRWCWRAAEGGSMTTAEQILEKALVHATVQTATDAAVDDLLSSSPGNRGSPYVVSTCTTALSRCLLPFDSSRGHSCEALEVADVPVPGCRP